MKLGRFLSLMLGALLGGALVSCTPHENPPPVTGTIAKARLLAIDSGGAPGHRSTIPVLAVRISITNPGAEVRLLGYRYETSQGIASEALMDRRLVEQSRSKLGRLVQLGLPTVFPAGVTTSGWVFFRTSDTKGRIHLSLRDVYGRFSALYLPVGQAFPKASRSGSGKAPGAAATP
ncbi:MAG: hypothetical protein M0T83_11560 [Nitrospiraceae bacterium]|nr:hypothetical protein [Nitrospiraceae bacterium]